MNKRTSFSLLILLLLAIPMFQVAADVDITVDTTGDINLDLTTTGNGTLLSIDYNGRDLLSEITAKVKQIEQLRAVIVSLAMRNDVEDLEGELEALGAELEKLVNELNLVLNDLYFKLGFQAHAIGINPGNGEVAEALMAGNATIADYLDGILIDLDVVDEELTSVHLRFQTITAGMVQYDLALVESHSADEALSNQIDSAVESFNEIFANLYGADADLADQIDVQEMDIEELRNEVSEVYDELLRERTTRNNLTILYLGFSVLVILAIFVTSRK